MYCYISFLFQGLWHQRHSILALLLYFDLVYGIVIDMLHCIFLGVVKALLHLWFDQSHRNEQYSLYSQVWKCTLHDIIHLPVSLT